MVTSHARSCRSLVSEIARSFRQAVEGAALHGADRDAEFDRDLRVGAIADGGGEHGVAVGRVDPGERVVQRSPVQERGDGVARVRRALCGLDPDRRRAAGASPDLVDDDVVQHRGQPAVHRGPCQVEGWAGPPRVDEHLLHRVIGDCGRRRAGAERGPADARGDPGIGSRVTVQARALPRGWVTVAYSSRPIET